MRTDFKDFEFENLLIQYKYFIDNIYNTYSCLDSLIVSLRNFLNDYYKLKDFDDESTSELELILSYFENYYQILFPIVDELEQFSMFDKENKEIKLDSSNVYSFYPKYYVDEDIYVPKDYQIDWDYIRQ